jgi:hypothetical protein
MRRKDKWCRGIREAGRYLQIASTGTGCARRATLRPIAVPAAADSTASARRARPRNLCSHCARV